MKAVILGGGLGTRLLPLSQIVPKQYLPLGVKPAFNYLVEEVRDSGVEEVIFVNSPGFKKMEDYFNPADDLKEKIEEEDKTSLLESLEELEQLGEQMEISSVTQQEPLGNGQAIYQARDLIGDDSFAVLFVDDIIDGSPPALEQLMKAFKTSQKPVIGLKQVEQKQFSQYGMASVEKISRHLFKVKDIIEKPSPEQAPSDLAVTGRFVLTPEIFDYLEKANPNQAGEKTIAAGLEGMRNNGKAVYGKQLRGEWLDCGDKLRYLKSNLYQIINHPRYREEIRNYLNEIL